MAPEYNENHCYNCMYYLYDYDTDASDCKKAEFMSSSSKSISLMTKAVAHISRKTRTTKRSKITWTIWKTIRWTKLKRSFKKTMLFFSVVFCYA